METNEQKNKAEAVTGPQKTTNPKKKNHHRSAMYAASLLHSAVKHVKAPNAGHGMLPVQM